MQFFDRFRQLRTNPLECPIARAKPQDCACGRGQFATTVQERLTGRPKWSTTKEYLGQLVLAEIQLFQLAATQWVTNELLMATAAQIVAESAGRLGKF